MERVWRRDYANHAEAIRGITDYIVGVTTMSGFTRNWGIYHRPFMNGRWHRHHLSRCPELVDRYSLTQKSFWEVASHLADGSLQTVLDAYEPEPVSFFAIHPVRVAQSRKVGLFIDSAVKWFDGFGES